MTENSSSILLEACRELFDPEIDNWLAYIERLEQFFAVNSIPDEKKV